MDNFWKTIWKSVFHPFACAKTICQYEKDIEKFKAEIKRFEKDIHQLRIISLVANDHGWNGVDNSKNLSFFIRDIFDELGDLRREQGKLNDALGILDLSMVIPLAQGLEAELKETRQENEDLKNINMRLHEKINLLTPAGLREKELFPTNYRIG